MNNNTLKHRNSDDQPRHSFIAQFMPDAAVAPIPCSRSRLLVSSPPLGKGGDNLYVMDHPRQGCPCSFGCRLLRSSARGVLISDLLK